VLQLVARDLGNAFPGIESDPGVAGGEPCIVRTRIPVWLLVRARQLGTSEADLLRSYPALPCRLGQLRRVRCSGSEGCGEGGGWEPHHHSLARGTRRSVGSRWM
jgi:uncharacterized protein (DUF433 family)